MDLEYLKQQVFQWNLDLMKMWYGKRHFQKDIHHRFLQGITEMIFALDQLTPGIASPDTILYGIEVKFYSSRIHLTENLESEICNLFTIGDGAGVTRGLVQASASGLVAAHEIVQRTVRH